MQIPSQARCLYPMTDNIRAVFSGGIHQVGKDAVPAKKSPDEDDEDDDGDGPPPGSRFVNFIIGYSAAYSEIRTLESVMEHTFAPFCHEKGAQKHLYAGLQKHLFKLSSSQFNVIKS